MKWNNSTTNGGFSFPVYWILLKWMSHFYWCVGMETCFLQYYFFFLVIDWILCLWSIDKSIITADSMGKLNDFRKGYSSRSTFIHTEKSTELHKTMCHLIFGNQQNTSFVHKRKWGERVPLACENINAFLSLHRWSFESTNLRTICHLDQMIFHLISKIRWRLILRSCVHFSVFMHSNVWIFWFDFFKNCIKYLLRLIWNKYINL